ncbi:MAG: hypothetical protein HYY06_01480 [Deltaproteobacteria bacterium]|nr:hypothetical protein [Deltaproteobacteria bacterium]
MSLPVAKRKAIETRWRRQRGCLPNELEVEVEGFTWVCEGNRETRGPAVTLVMSVTEQADLLRRHRLVGQHSKDLAGLRKALEAVRDSSRTRRLREAGLLGTGLDSALKAMLSLLDHVQGEIVQTAKLQAERRRGNRAPDDGLAAMQLLRRATPVSGRPLTYQEIADFLNYVDHCAVSTLTGRAVRDRLARAVQSRRVVSARRRRG